MEAAGPVAQQPPQPLTGSVKEVRGTPLILLLLTPPVIVLATVIMLVQGQGQVIMLRPKNLLVQLTLIMCGCEGVQRISDLKLT